MANKIWKGLC